MIEVRNISKKIGERHIFHNLTFTLEAGAIYGILGPNGTGKSTLLALLSGAVRADVGDVIVGNKPIDAYRRRELAQVMAVLQQGELAELSYTVREVVAMGRYPFQNWLGVEQQPSNDIVEQTLAMTSLTELADRRMEQLSGGEKQRVALAKVIAQQPHFLLLDEPTTHLDIGYQMRLLDVVKQWQQTTALTVVVVLHDMNLAAQYCDELLFLHDGQLAARGRPADVLQPELIERIFGARAVVVNHPVTAIPQLLLYPSGEFVYDTTN